MYNVSFYSLYSPREKRARFCKIGGPRVPLPIMQYIRLWRHILWGRHDGVTVTALHERAPKRYFELNGSLASPRTCLRVFDDVT